MSKYTEAYLAAAAAVMGLDNPPSGHSHSSCYRSYERHEAGKDCLSPTDPRLTHGQGVHAGLMALQAKYELQALCAASAPSPWRGE